MWSSVILLLLLAQIAATDTNCTILKQRYRTNGTAMIEVLAMDEAVETVVRGSGGASRAAAALLLVAIRHVKGYQASLNTTFVQPCDLLKNSMLREAAVVSPVVMLPTQEGCNTTQNFAMFTNLALPAVVSYELFFWAYVPPVPCSGYIQDLIQDQWVFFKNYSKVKDCGFITSRSINLNSSEYSFVVLARNESTNDNKVTREFQKRFDATNLQLQIEYFQSDFLMRKKISELKNLGNTFLFLDEGLWFKEKNMINVQLPPCTNNSSTTCTSTFNPVMAFRVGNGMFMNEFAPPISRLVNNFSPNASQLLQILKIETEQNNSHIEDAACKWALVHVEEFHNIILYNSSDDQNVFHIKIILCGSDPLYNDFTNNTKLIRENINRNIKNVVFKMYKKKINCLDEEDLVRTVKNYKKHKDIAGVIAWSLSEGTISAAKVAEHAHLPLLLVGPVAPEVQLGLSVKAVTGQLADLTRVLHYLLDCCEWSRIAILSDNSAYSKSFVHTLIEQRKLLYRNEIVRYRNISLQLDELEKADARIFLLNVNWSISCQILCAALKRGMTSTNGFVWIARDWRPLECCTNNTWDGMYHYTINFGWQGEPLENGSDYLKSNLQKLYKIKGASEKVKAYSDFSTLADALLQLSHGFSTFLKKSPNYTYRLRSLASSLKFSQILENITISWVAQENKKNTLRYPLIFINKWQGVVREYVGVFQVIQNKVFVRQPINSTCKSLFGSQFVRDRPNCRTILSGDLFSPRCQDFTVVIVTVLLILFVIALYMARRSRLKRSLHRELNIRASILEIRKHTASSLDMYLVNRNAIKLLHEIGSGSFGRVHFAELQRPGKGTIVVAAKEPRKDIGPTEECEFFHEACVLAPLYHDNIIRLVGICIKNGPPIVLMEHAFYLDLKRYLTERRHLLSGKYNDITDNRAIEVSDESLTRLACEAASALAYLTTRRLVHRDVRAANCLIDKKRSLKLGDFGMARELDVKAPEYTTIRRALFPVLWMAPESLQLGVFSFATDIWSLGVLMLEVTTLGARPYGDWEPSHVLNYVSAGGFPPLPPDVSKQASSLLHCCWQPKAELRPSASWVHKYLTHNSRALSPALLKPHPPDHPTINIE